MSEPRIFLGVVDVDGDEKLALYIPPNASPDEIRAAIARANAARREALAEEARKLREMFLKDGRHD
jgi:hypothetical protein